LGESRDLVNAISLLPEGYQGESLQWLIQDEDGLLTLPYWVDHVGSKGTRWLRYILDTSSDEQLPPDGAWTSIQTA
jgi:CRISPR-associated protein Cas5t